MSSIVTTPDTPVEKESWVRRRRRLLYLFLVLFVIGTYVFWRIVPQPAQEYDDIQQHFKYGSIGAENRERGIPVKLWQALPQLFPEHLPSGNGDGYDRFGFIIEPGMDRPIGFSTRRVLGVELIGLNCAACHAGSVRASPESGRQIVLGMPSNTVDLQAYFEFLFECAGDGRFTVENMMTEIHKRNELDWYERLAYPSAIREFREKALAQKEKLKYWKRTPKFGPGRVDTFNPYKVLFFGETDPGSAVGTADFPSLWNQRPREGMNLHWDGNNSSVQERNISAAIGAGVVAPHGHQAIRPTLDEPSMRRIRDWIMDFEPPKFPESQIKRGLAQKGEVVFNRACWSCHGMKRNPEGEQRGEKVGLVTPIDAPMLRTDPQRLNSFTPDLPEKMNTWGDGYSWKFSHFRKTDGYANSPLDGLWLRAPYLHNGSVPNLHALLWPKTRPKTFSRGNDVYDWEKVGFKFDREGGFFEFNTQAAGNDNTGHTYGADLSDEEKTALLEYLKTL